MARTPLTDHPLAPSGVGVSWEAAVAEGASVPSGWGTVVLVWNNSNQSITVTIPRPGLADGAALADRTVTVGANTIVSLGQMDPALYSQADGMIYLNFSATTNVWLILVRA